MTITYEPHLTRGPLRRSRPTFPSYQRAYDYSWFKSGVGKTMRRGNRCSEEVYWAWLKTKAKLQDLPKDAHEERTALKQRFRAKKNFFLRRAHVYWRRGHRVRRAQWYTQDASIFRSLALLFHYLMQKHHERAFASRSKA